MRRWLALGTFATVVVAGLVFALIPGLTRERGYPASIPSPPALDRSEVVRIPPHKAACFENAVMEEHSEQARFQVGLARVPPQPLELGIDGPGVHQRIRVPPTYVDNTTVVVPVTPPKRATPVRVC